MNDHKELQKIKNTILMYLLKEVTQEELMNICEIVNCPVCGELVFEDELQSTEQTTGIGSICSQCIEDGRSEL